MAKLILESLMCDEPATSFGDDIDIYVGVEQGAHVGNHQISIDKGQIVNLTKSEPYEFDVQEGDTITIDFKEDSDPAGKLDVHVPTAWPPEYPRSHREQVTIKEDGRYWLFYELQP